MAGKLTDDKAMSASRLPGLMGFSKYSTPNDELQYSINALDGKERPDIGNEAMGWGNTLEPVILEQAAKRLGLEEINAEITVPYKHRTLAFQCSLDGVGFGLVLKVLEVRKIITSIKHALSIVRYFEFHMLTVAGWMIIKMKVRWLIADWNNSNSLGQWDRVSHIEIFDGASFLLSFT